MDHLLILALASTSHPADQGQGYVQDHQPLWVLDDPENLLLMVWPSSMGVQTSSSTNEMQASSPSNGEDCFACILDILQPFSCHPHLHSRESSQSFWLEERRLAYTQLKLPLSPDRPSDIGLSVQGFSLFLENAHGRQG